MSWSGRLCDHLRDWGVRFPGRIESYVWQEDIDLNAAAGALAAATGTLKDVDKVGTDAYRLRKGYGVPEIVAIAGMDESGGGAGGYLQIQGRARKVRFGKLSQVAANEWWEYIPAYPIAVPEGSQVDVVGNQAGSGAENHCVIVYVHYPLLKKPAMLSKPFPSRYGPLGLKTGTRVADTVGPWTAVPLTGWEDSELAFSSDPSLEFVIEQLINGPGLADTSVVGIRWPMGETDMYELYVPASMAGSETIFNLPMIPFSADNPPKLAAAGHSTTSDEYTFVIGCSAQYGDTNSPGGQSSKPAQPPPSVPTQGLAAMTSVQGMGGTLPALGGAPRPIINMRR